MSDYLGADAAAFLNGRTIVVKGTARKVRINFYANGRETGKYYYQTHLTLTDPTQLRVEGETPRS